jgi:hypothetical protein
MNIKELEEEVNIKTDILNLLKTNETINNLTLKDISFAFGQHSRSKIVYTYACLHKSCRLKKRIKVLVSTENDFDIETEEGQEIIKERLQKYWKKYVKKYYPEYINLLNQTI